MTDRRWSTNPEEIKVEDLRFFSSKFHERHTSCSRLTSNRFSRLSHTEAQSLESPFSHEEIKVAVWACGSDKAPRPDGFSFKFIKSHWSFLGADIINYVKHFEHVGTISPGCNSSFISLVPKIKDPLKMNDYRPISLIGCLYKITAKLLETRLKKVVGSIIGEAQSAYVAGRNILDGPLIVNEVCS